MELSIRAQGIKASYRRQLSSRITVRRSGEEDCQVRSRVTGYSEAEIVAGIQEGRRMLIILAEDVTWLSELREGDLALVDGAELYINTVDNQRRRVDGTLIAYEVTATGR